MPKKEYKIGDIVDLDDVMISPAAYMRWQAVASMGAQALAQIAPGENFTIPDEQGLWLASSELEIFVEVAGSRISMKIPADQWAWS